MFKFKKTTDYLKFKKSIYNYFKPSIYISHFSELNLDALKQQGIKLIFCDLDNTLVPHYKIMPTANNLKFIKNIRDRGMTFVLISNNFDKRVKKFSEKAGVNHYFSMAKKPMTHLVKKFMKEHGFQRSETVIMGDQLVTDIFMANRLQIESILVLPIVSTDKKINVFNRWLERQIYKKLEKNNILIRGEYNEKWTNNPNEEQLL